MDGANFSTVVVLGIAAVAGFCMFKRANRGAPAPSQLTQGHDDITADKANLVYACDQGNGRACVILGERYDANYLAALPSG